MKRRAFLQTSVAAIGAAAAASAVRAADPSAPGEVYEFRSYTLKPGKLPILDEYLGKALLPALKRHGVGPVGVFTENGTEDQGRVYALIVYPSAAQVVGLAGKLADDEEHNKAAAAYLAAPAKEPVYSRIESSLLLPIAGMPKLQKPDVSKPRLLNLRIYESHNERAALKKVEMFDKAELAIFRRVGLTPVFFARTIVGAGMPNLTYMLVFPDDAGRQAAWSRFGGDAEWKKLRAIPEYADKEIVSKITNKILTPTAYSEI